MIQNLGVLPSFVLYANANDSLTRINTFRVVLLSLTHFLKLRNLFNPQPPNQPLFFKPKISIPVPE